MASPPDALVPVLAENLRSLYLGTDDAARRRADHFLQKIQRGPESWALADAILGGRTPFAPSPPDLTADAVSPTDGMTMSPCAQIIFADMPVTHSPATAI